MSKIENIRINDKSVESKNRSKHIKDYLSNSNEMSTYMSNNEVIGNKRLLNMSVDDYKTYMKPVMNRRNNQTNQLQFKIKGCKSALKSLPRQKSTSN